MSKLTGCTQQGVRRWLCVGCRICSPGQCESLLLSRPLPPCRSHRLPPTAETPEEMSPASQKTWKNKRETVGELLWQAHKEQFLLEKAKL